MNLNFREMMMKSKHRGLGVKELLKWRAIQQKEKIQIGGDFNFTDPEPDYEESKAETDSTIGYVKRRNTFCRRTLLRKKSSFLRNTHISLLESVHPEGWNPMWSFSSMLGDSFIHDSCLASPNQS
ncbi:hypothetical protein AAHE18_02G024800 [Arachis hypogaea]